MCKEKFYARIKHTIYRKFNELELVERNDGNDLHFRYKDEEYPEIRVEKKPGELYYYTKFKDKITKQIPMSEDDFEVILNRWAEDKFKMKFKDTFCIISDRKRIS